MRASCPKEGKVEGELPPGEATIVAMIYELYQNLGSLRSIWMALESKKGGFKIFPPM